MPADDPGTGGELIDLARYRLSRKCSRVTPIFHLDLSLASESHNDIGNARRLLARFGHRILFVAGAGWCVRSAHGWAPDRGGVIVCGLAQEMAAAIANEVAALRNHDQAAMFDGLAAAALAGRPARELQAIERRWQRRWAKLARWGIRSGRRYWATLRAAAPYSLAAQRRDAS